jgi:hypothetical protein
VARRAGERYLNLWEEMGRSVPFEDAFFGHVVEEMGSEVMHVHPERLLFEAVKCRDEGRDCAAECRGEWVGDEGSGGGARPYTAAHGNRRRDDGRCAARDVCGAF